MKTSQDPRHKRRQRIVKQLFTYSFQPQIPPPASIAKIVQNFHQIDQLIGRAAPQFPPEKLNKIDLAILRLAVFELKLEKKQPPKVIIDEAVELGKEYGSEKSPKFINGALGSILKLTQKQKMEPVEEKVIELASFTLGVEKGQISKNSHLFDDLNADKVAIADLFLACEEEFAIKLPLQNLEKIQTIADLVTLIEEGSDELL